MVCTLSLCHMQLLLTPQLGAIESDIARLSLLTPTSFWPTSFVDLNVARNFVGRFCYDNKFRYTGWPDLELHRYRMFVNFNMAKYAYRNGEFGIKEQEPRREDLKQKMVGGARQKDEVTVLKMRVPASEKSEDTLFHVDAEQGYMQGVKIARQQASSDTSDLLGTLSTISFESEDPLDRTESNVEVGNLGNQNAEAASAVQEDAKTVDPFKVFEMTAYVC
jgi:hypothetical protein